jgi:peptidyl-prolyl cis-trans isomerase D
MPLSEVPERLRAFAATEDKNTIYGPYEEDGSFKLAKLLDVANRPDSVHARHILISPNASRTLAQAKNVADSLARLLRNGANFEELARANSDDQGSAQLGGDLGWFTEGRMVAPFNDACFTGSKGDIKIAETSYGYHVIQLVDVSKSIRKYKIGIIDRKILPGSATNQRIFNEASMFAGQNDTYDKFNKAVASKGLNKRVATDIAPQQNTLPGLDNPRYLIMALFQTEPGKIVLDNNQQAVFEIGGKYVVAFCTRAQEEGIAPLKDVENDIRFALVKDKKAELLSKQFSSDQGKSLDQIARDQNVTVQEATGINFRSYSVPGAGTEPALVAAATAGTVGAVEGPVKGLNGVYMFVVNNSVPVENQDAKILRDRLQSNFQMRGSYEAYDALLSKANVKDMRYKFY